MSKFLELLEIDVRKQTKTIQGYAYVPWALALSMAGRPAHEVVTFKQGGVDSTVRQLFGGGVVAVDMSLGDGTADMQRVYLPVLDLKNDAMAYEEIDGRDANDAISRCVARAVAIVHGYGLSLYSLTKGNGTDYARCLAVNPDTPDLGQVPELRDIKEIKKNGRVVRAQEYLGWHACVAACRITDPSFVWEVVEWLAADPETGELCAMPAMRVAGKGWMVGVRIKWRGRVHTQMLPIMGVETRETANGPKRMEHQAIDNPTVFDWHSAVMRCLAKGVAIATGYGISSYAGEHAAPGGVECHDPDDDGTLSHQRPDAPAVGGTGQGQQQPPQRQVNQRQQQGGQQRQQQRSEQGAPRGAGSSSNGQQAASEEGLPDRTKIIATINSLLTETGSNSEAFVAWLGVDKLASAEVAVLERGRDALVERKERIARKREAEQQSQSTQQLH